MTDKDKERIFELYKMGYGHKKISSILNLNANTVKSCVRRIPKSKIEICVCEECGKPITQTPHKKPKRFCSDDCRFAWWAKHKDLSNRPSSKVFICKYCGKEFLDNEKRERTYCSKSCFAAARHIHFTAMREESDARTTPCGTELSDLPSDCLCASCRWFVDGKRICCCKKALAEKI